MAASSVASPQPHIRTPRETISASIARRCALIGMCIGEPGRDRAALTASSRRASPSSLAVRPPTSWLRLVGLPCLGARLPVDPLALVLLGYHGVKVRL